MQIFGFNMDWQQANISKFQPFFGKFRKGIRRNKVINLLVNLFYTFIDVAREYLS